MEQAVGSQQPVSGPKVASLGKRIVAALIDLVLVPILLGMIVGLILLALPESVRPFILIPVNIAWLLVRDLFFAPGRMIMKIKLVSATGAKITFVQALLRNILLIIPFVLVIGYIVEFIVLCIKGDRLADKWAKTRSVEV